MIIEFKVCGGKGCGRTLPLNAFPPNRRMASGRATYCKGCYKTFNAASKAARGGKAVVRTVECCTPGCTEIDPRKFGKDRSRSNGLAARCRACRRRRGTAACPKCAGPMIAGATQCWGCKVGPAPDDADKVKICGIGKGRAHFRETSEPITNGCRQLLPYSAFGILQSAPTGRAYYCLRCKRRLREEKKDRLLAAEQLVDDSPLDDLDDEELEALEDARAHAEWLRGQSL